jgi:hypothetical protein
VRASPYSFTARLAANRYVYHTSHFCLTILT